MIMIPKRKWKNPNLEFSFQREKIHGYSESVLVPVILFWSRLGTTHTQYICVYIQMDISARGRRVALSVVFSIIT